MVKIHFKNVGQGDSIIIEWKDKEVSKCGLIDCNLFDGRNPTLEFIKDSYYKNIEFIILTHPHYDHFSGIPELFNWCLINNININSFLITSEIVPEYITTALKSATAKSSLSKLFKLARELRDKTNMAIYTINDNPDTCKVIEDWELSFLSPSSKEQDNFLRDVKSFSREEEFHNNPNGNWLSTLIFLKRKDECVLLTSDIEKDTLTRIKKDRKIYEKIILGQVPHHGSKKNNNQIFWSLVRRKENTPMAISVGKNKYGHPSNHVLKIFEKLQYNVVRTDLNNTQINVNEDENVIDSLDSVSELIEEMSFSSKGKDLLFEI